jgi:thioredoxin 1
MTDGLVIAVTEETYHDVVLNNRDLILVAFMTENDSSCRALRPILADLARERAGSLVVTSVDVTANPSLADSWGIADVPAMLLFHRGRLERVLRGVRPLARLKREIDEVAVPPAPVSRYSVLG